MPNVGLPGSNQYIMRIQWNEPKHIQQILEWPSRHFVGSAWGAKAESIIGKKYRIVRHRIALYIPIDPIRSSMVGKRFLALGRLRLGQRNKLEQSYEAELERRKRSGEIVWYKFEGIKLRLADNCFFTPDFSVMKSNGEFEFHECKSYWVGDAKPKIRIAAELYPFRFYAVYAKTKKDGGGFQLEEF